MSQRTRLSSHEVVPTDLLMDVPDEGVRVRPNFDQDESGADNPHMPDPEEDGPVALDRLFL